MSNLLKDLKKIDDLDAHDPEILRLIRLRLTEDIPTTFGTPKVVPATLITMEANINIVTVVPDPSKKEEKDVTKN